MTQMHSALQNKCLEKHIKYRQNYQAPNFRKTETSLEFGDIENIQDLNLTTNYQDFTKNQAFGQKMKFGSTKKWQKCNSENILI